MDIIDLYQLSEWQLEVIRIAHDLDQDPKYSKDDAAKDLIDLAYIINMAMVFENKKLGE
ncbi:hypothetical protein [Evansella tamaricis]|uniref:Phage protein n=1 Tax=Evansella tamaricis TaxID=2069301 RepID=A0ABS6JD43_9BACI|nr:hypothetical protein [Evansella tamaricis]MBU9711114.1 hypothetical protein [Evansella tamaricis]